MSLHGVLREGSARLIEGVGPLCGVHIAVAIDGHAFARCALIHAILTREWRDESHNALLVHRSDAATVVPVWMVQRSCLGVDHVEHVALDEDSARAAEHIARLEVLSVLIEDFEAVVPAIGHPEPTLRVERERMRRAELAVTHADRPP